MCLMLGVSLHVVDAGLTVFANRIAILTATPSNPLTTLDCNGLSIDFTSNIAEAAHHLARMSGTGATADNFTSKKQHATHCEWDLSGRYCGL